MAHEDALNASGNPGVPEAETPSTKVRDDWVHVNLHADPRASKRKGHRTHPKHKEHPVSATDDDAWKEAVFSGAPTPPPLPGNLHERVATTVDIFLGTWMDAVGQALQELPDPDDVNSIGAINFIQALAGNMAWAATSLFPAAKVAVAGVSFVGAALGSGVGKLEENKPSADGLKKEIRARLRTARDKLAQTFRSGAKQIAEAIVKKNRSVDIDAFDKTLWTMIFPKAGFDASEDLFKEAASALALVRTEFTNQWKAWDAKCVEKAKKNFKEHHNILRRVLMDPAEEIGLTLAEELPKVRQEEPFTFQL